MAGVAENLNVCVTLGGNDFPLSDYRTTIKRLSNDFSTPLWGLYFGRYCIYDTSLPINRSEVFCIEKFRVLL